MFRNHFKIAWRNITRHRMYTVINVLGLALGLCAFIVIYQITHYELSFDTFHPDKDRIYRVLSDVTETTGGKSHYGKVPLSLSLTARKELSGLDAMAVIIPWYAKTSVRQSDKSAKYFDNRLEGTSFPGAVLAQSSWFTLFKYDWLAGNATAEPYTVVLAESIARKYFGRLPLDKIVGREVIYDDSLHVRVSGIVKDWNKNTDFPFTDFISFATFQSSFLKNVLDRDSWGEGDLPAPTFVKLSEGASLAKMNAQMAALVKSHTDPRSRLSLRLQPLSDIHFDADIIENPVRTAHMPTLYGLTGIALFILILAVINFINLSTAQSFQRAKEVGVRKVLGSSRRSLVFQFLTETFLLTFFAVLLAGLLVNPVLDLFRSYIPAGVVFHPFELHSLVFLSVVTLLTSLAAGFYPAKLLSGYLPVLSLKGGGVQKGGEKWYVRKGLIVFQFTVSLVFIIGSIVIADQLHYASHKDLGFTSDAIITVGTPRGEGNAKVRVLAEKIKQLSAVSGVALEWATPGNAAYMRIKFKPTDDKEAEVAQVDGDENLIPLYRIRLLAGRNLSRSDSVNEFVINETLSRSMGCKKPEEAIGKILYWMDKPYPVVGVAGDFHSRSLHNPITPVCIINRVEREDMLAVKLAANAAPFHTVKTTLTQMEKLWKSVYPAGIFQYSFYDESLAMAYKNDQNTASLMNTAMLITIFISCIGLSGLAMFAAQTRTREIGIRKVLGASVTNITLLLSRDFSVLVVLSVLIASPIAWYFMEKWLSGFAYRVMIGWWVFPLAGLAALLVAFATVSYQTIQAAVANPVKNLRSE